MVFMSCLSSCCVFHRAVTCCRCVVLQLHNGWIGPVSSKENVFAFDFGDSVWTLQSNIAQKFCFRKVDERFSCNRNVQRPEELQLILLRDGHILLYLRGFRGCWLLMFFPGGCQHCSFHTGVQLLWLWFLCVNREVRWKFCRVISLASPWRVTWRNSVCRSFTRMAFGGGRVLLGWGVFERCSQGSSIWRWNTRESWCIILCDYVLHTWWKNLTLFGFTVADYFKESSSLKLRDEIKNVHWSGNEEEAQWLPLKWVDWL